MGRGAFLNKLVGVSFQSTQRADTTTIDLSIMKDFES